jgi:hypothetical protein
MRFDRLVPGQVALKADNENALRAAVEGLLNITGSDVYVGPTGVHFRRPPPPARHALVKITGTIAVGRYNARLITGPPAYAATGALAEAESGGFPAADNAIAVDPESVGLATALPLTGLVTTGRVVGTAGDKSVVEIPPPGVRDVRFNTTTKRLQVAYVSNPADGDWVDKVNFTAC